MQVRRKDACPCGSGRNFQNCCMRKSGPPVDLLWHRLRKAHDTLVDRLLNYAQKRVGEQALAYAAAEFLVWPEGEELDEMIKDQMLLFMPWFLFNWVYEAEESEISLDLPSGVTVAEIYLAENTAPIGPLEMRLIEAALHKPFSFFEVLDCQPGLGFTLKDLFTGRKTRVAEKSGSCSVHVGDILLTRIARVDHVSMLEGCSSIALRPTLKPKIVQLRRQMKKRYPAITDESVGEYDVEIRELYLKIYYSLMRAPRMVNTDGEPILMHTLRYRIDDPQEAFEKLCSLAGGNETPDTLRRIAVLDAAGRVIQVEIPWLRSGPRDSTFMGQLVIDHRSLVVEVNSSVRAESITAEIRKRLGRSAKHLATETRLVEK